MQKSLLTELLTNIFWAATAFKFKHDLLNDKLFYHQNSLIVSCLVCRGLN